MKSITVTIKEKEGLHARPAGVLCKLAKEHQSKMTLTKGEKTADLTRLFAIMGLAVKCGDTVTFCCEGADEDEAFAALQEVLKDL